MSKHLHWRTLIRFMGLNRDLHEARIVMCSWAPNQQVAVSLDKIPEKVLDAYDAFHTDPDNEGDYYRCHAKVNTGVNDPSKFTFKEWETS